MEAYKGFRVRFGKPSDATAERVLRLLLLRNQGAPTIEGNEVIRLAIGKLLVNAWVVEHNFTGYDGKPIPPGADLFDVFGPDLALGLLDYWSHVSYKREDRTHPSVRLYPMSHQARARAEPAAAPTGGTGRAPVER